MATTTITTETQYGAGLRSPGILVGLGGEGDTAVDATYSTKAGWIALRTGQLTKTP